MQKVWEDDDNRDGLRASEVIVRLYADGTYTGLSKTLNAGNSWSATFTDLNKKSSGVDIVYTVTEDPVPGYTADYTATATGYTIKNTHTPYTPSEPSAPQTPSEPSAPQTPSVPPAETSPEVVHSPKTGSPEGVVSWMALFSGLAAVYLSLRYRRKREE